MLNVQTLLMHILQLEIHMFDVAGSPIIMYKPLLVDFKAQYTFNFIKIQTNNLRGTWRNG